ncbi:hypothetical protein SAMN04488115_110154 [Bosea lathyri]|uniref:Uncharacterized protein n=1 Tax=Bosea lathyri TaxID=1036778 RepID=A0A1H6CIL3_9HYPH|nr:hypothetical protein SAMN04488115_110154 [Bosea lathyri]
MTMSSAEARIATDTGAEPTRDVSMTAPTGQRLTGGILFPRRSRTEPSGFAGVPETIGG